jgi:hypothetical protein
MFVPSDNGTIHMSGGFWMLASQSMTETTIPAAGGVGQSKVIFSAGTSGAQTHAVSLRKLASVQSMRRSKCKLSEGS